jgi:Dyp-type peroxidase family
MRSPLLAEEVLADIQGFITSGYGHLSHAAYLFVQIHDPEQGQRWLARLAPEITSSRPWPVGPNGQKVKPPVAVNVAFSAGGLAAIGLPPAVMSTFSAEFQEGVAHPLRSKVIGDTEESDPAQWEIGGTARPPIHAVLVVHAASEAGLEAACGALRARLGDEGRGVSELPESMQRGYRPHGDHEPFGFHDGIAQPSIAGVSGDGVPTGEFILGYPNHFQIIPPGPVVPAELDRHAVLPPLGNPYHASRQLRDLGINGSYIVYRKLRQDVAAFWQFMKRETIRATGATDVARMIWLAAKCVGRWPSGAPLVLTPHADDPAAGDRDDFLYGSDPDGFSCPLGAHIRRTNPRDVIKPYAAAQSLSMSEAHRLLRRARSFGPALFDPAVLTDPANQAGRQAMVDLVNDDRARGIHFFCVNASIRSQFEFVQQTWCNNPRFGGLNDNKDPILGDNGRAGETPSHMTIPRRPFRLRTSALPRFVTVRGGAYLFMPSLTALRFFSSFNARARGV